VGDHRRTGHRRGIAGAAARAMIIDGTGPMATSFPAFEALLAKPSR